MELKNIVHVSSVILGLYVSIGYNVIFSVVNNKFKLIAKPNEDTDFKSLWVFTEDTIQFFAPSTFRQYFWEFTEDLYLWTLIDWFALSLKI